MQTFSKVDSERILIIQVNQQLNFNLCQNIFPGQLVWNSSVIYIYVLLHMVDVISATQLPHYNSPQRSYPINWKWFTYLFTKTTTQNYTFFFLSTVTITVSLSLNNYAIYHLCPTHQFGLVLPIKPLLNILKFSYIIQ